MAILEDSSDLDSKLFPAYIALVKADSVTLPIELADLLFAFAVRANGAIGPKPGFNKSVGGFFIVKTGIR
jgi:hypothetical protein